MNSYHDPRDETLAPTAPVGRAAEGTPTERDAAAYAVAVSEALLSERLGRLREARPAYQAELEARLVAELPGARRPWWRRPFAMSGRRNGRATLGTRRKALLGMAAAAVGILAAASMSLPMGRPPEVSAAEILEKAQSLAENPFLAEVKSFHLTAKSTGKLRPGGDSSARTVEQWFAAPDRMRMETRFQAPDGSAVVNGVVDDGTRHRFYSTPGAEQYGMVGFLVMPAPARRVEGEPGRGAAKVDADVVWVSKAPGPDGAIKPSAPPEKKEMVASMRCPEPKRKGEGSVAGRAVYIVEADMSACTVLTGADKLDDKDGDLPGLGGRHTAWIDKETFLPLKMEDYAKDGKLVHSYEVSAVEYDVSVPDAVFVDIPPKGTVINEGPLPDRGPQGDSGGPAEHYEAIEIEIEVGGSGPGESVAPSSR